MSSAPQLLVDVIRRDAGWNVKVSDRALTSAAQAAFACSGCASGPAELSLLLSDDDEIRMLNKTWRGKDEPTNVLSFPLGAMPGVGGARPLGDVALAYQTVANEALTRGISIDQHAVHLVVHGVLHLMDYDHTSDADAREMETLEAQILAGLGLPDPYALDVIAAGKGR